MWISIRRTNTVEHLLRNGELDLVRLLEMQQRLFEEHGRVAVVCTALFFLAIWPAPIDHEWTACKSMRLA